MKALSIRQPWAWLIVQGFKDVENRDWNTRFRGELLIHASKGMTLTEYLQCQAYCARTEIILPQPEELLRGGIVGSAELVDCVTDHHSFWFNGEYGLVFKNAKVLTFQPARGALGLFEIVSGMK